jgi:hypothetical protein
MTDFEACWELFEQLSVPHCPRKHWSANFGWDMANSMAAILADYTKKILAEAKLYAISVD